MTTFTSFGNLEMSQVKNNLFDLSTLSPQVKKHITKVYITLGGTLVAASLGAYTHLLYNVGGILTTIAQFIALFSLIGVPHSQENIPKRLAILQLFGFFVGCSIGPLISYVLQIDPRIILTAFLGTLCIFVCFSSIAIFSGSRTWLFLGGFLSSSISLMILMSFLNFFFRSPAILMFQVYFGLLVFMGFVIFDTQMMIEQAKVSDDFIWHSVQLFIDFVAIFVRLLIILSQKNKKKN